MRSKPSVWCLLSGAVLLAWTAASGAQEEGVPAGGEAEAQEPVELGEVVVTATRYEKPAAEVPGSVDVVTRSDIQSRHAYGADEAIKFSPGVYDQRRKGPADIMPSFSIRGFKSDTRCIVLVDGAVRRDWLHIPPGAIERIEVAKGPFSALYGDQAMGGVVNVITRSPEETIRELTLGTESHDTTNVGLILGDKIGALSFLLTAGQRRTEGYVGNYYVRSEYTGATLPIASVTGWEETTDSYGSTRYLAGDKGRNWAEGEHYGLSLRYEVTPEARFGVQLYHRDYLYGYEGGRSYLCDVATGDVINDGVVELAGTGGTRISVSSTGLESSYGGEPCEGVAFSYNQKLGGKVELGLKLGWDTEDHWYASESASYSTTESDQSWAGLQSVFRPAEQHVLLAGVDYRGCDADFGNWGLSDWQDVHSLTKLNYSMFGDVRTFGVYVQEEWKAAEGVRLFVGGRFDNWHTEAGTHTYWDSGSSSYITESYPVRNEDTFNPKLAVNWIPAERTRLRASLGTAFRGPAANDLYKDWAYGSKLYRGNPDLGPERNFAWELGVERDVWEGGKAGLAYFDNRMDDFIARRDYDAAEVAAYNAAHGTTFTAVTQYDNVADARSAGVELSLTHKPSSGLGGFISYTYNDTEVLSNPARPESEGKRLTYVPENLVGLGVSYRRRLADGNALSASLGGRYVGKVYTADDNSDTVEGVFGGYDSFLVADFKLSYDAGGEYTLSVYVNNLFDEEYYQYYEAPGRTLGVELAARF